jgi:hypothetical protein
VDHLKNSQKWLEVRQHEVVYDSHSGFWKKNIERVGLRTGVYKKSLTYLS